MHRRQKASRFSVIIGGTGGCGKSTLINALCGGRDVASTTEWLDTDPLGSASEQPLRLRTYTEDINDPDLGYLTLRLIETSNLGQSLDSSEYVAQVLRYVEAQFDEVLGEESRIKRNPRFTDNRIHALVWLIEPTGHGLRELDIEIIKTLGSRVNVIPALAKADSLTRAEILLNKRLVREDIERYELPVFHLRVTDDITSDELEEEARKIQEALPFAVVAASGPTRVRKYPWGTVHIEDPQVSDFAQLRDLLLYSHMDDLRDTTYDDLYEQYRTLRLSQDTGELGLKSPPLSSTTTAALSVQPDYVLRENQLRAEESALHHDEEVMQRELELRRQELRKRELEVQRLEERLKKGL